MQTLEYRQLGKCGLRGSVLSVGTMAFGGRGRFGKVERTDLDGARRQIDLCLGAGVNLIDTANYSGGLSVARRPVGSGRANIAGASSLPRERGISAKE